MDRADIGPRLDPLCHAQRKIWAVDGDHHIRFGRDHRLGGLVDAGHQRAVFRQDLGNAHHRQFGHVKAAVQPFGGHVAAADPLETHIGTQGFQSGHQGTAQAIPGRLARDDKHLHSAARAQSTRPRSSARVTQRAGSRTITPPAAITTPARPARCAASSVAGPMEGMSTRRL